MTTPKPRMAAIGLFTLIAASHAGPATASDIKADPVIMISERSPTPLLRVTPTQTEVGGTVIMIRDDQRVFQDLPADRMISASDEAAILRDIVARFNPDPTPSRPVTGFTFEPDLSMLLKPHGSGRLMIGQDTIQ